MAIHRDRILKDAEKLVQKGKIQQAIREYEKLLKDNPSDTNTVNRVGDLYNRVGQIDRAVELYEQIADSFTADGFTNKAIAIYKKINRLAPQRVDVFEKLAELYIQQGLVFEAKSQYQMLAEWYLNHDDLDNAIKTHKRLISIDPENHMAHLKLADLLLQTGEVEEGLGQYNRLGAMLLERDKLDEAERLYRHALEQNPPTGGFLAPLCRHLAESGRLDSARFFLQEGRKRSPEDRDLGLAEIDLLLATGDAQAAVSGAENLLAHHPNDPEVGLLAGRALLATGEAERAVQQLAPAADNLIRRGELNEAQRLSRDLLKARPTDPAVLGLAIRAYEHAGDRDMLTTLKASLADVHYRSGDTKRAHSAYMELLQGDPQNKLFRERLANLDGAGAEVVSEPAPQVAVAEDFATPDIPEPAPAAPDPSTGVDAEERLAEARVFAKYGLVDKALKHLREIVEQAPDHMGARATLVELALEAGVMDVAVREAPPLMEHYQAAGESKKLAELQAAMPQWGASEADAGGPPAAEAAVADSPAGDEDVEFVDADELLELSDDVLVVELDEDFDVEQPAPTDDQPVAEDPFFEAEIAEESMQDGRADDGTESAAGADADDATPMDFPPMERPIPTETGVRAAAEMVDSFLGDVVDRPSTTAAAKPEPAEPMVWDELVESGTGTPVLEADAVVGAGDLDSTEDLVEISDSFAGPPQGELEQIDFFLEQSLYDDALHLLRRLETEYPQDPELSRRRMSLKARGVLLDEVAPTQQSSEELFGEEESYIDLAKELEDELAAEEAMVEEATGRGQDEAELEEVFREFQKGVAEQLSEEDSDTHFNLGIAYKEMGLLPEAIREFQVASRDQNFFVECCSMIGVCYVEQGLWDQAASWYGKALEATELTQGSTLALRYDLANALEGSGDLEQAAMLFSQIHSEDPTFRDVTQRINLLTDQRQAN
jgi:pilus assembly protein FimV